ncbi:MAG: galactosyldiacylglycerol synthase [Oscillospiraceae bacterium]|nr:galactosyldiacylglycerol synthase [Oscillospiraceae bacterium]
MKVLFLSLPTGHGHNMCAQAAIECLEKGGAECLLMDVAEFINPTFAKAISKGFLISAKTGLIYDNVYRFVELKEEPSPKISMSRIVNALLPLKLKGFLKQYKPDVIVCTHVFAAQMLTELKRTSRIRAKTYGIITDFTVHPFWEDTELDFYVLPHEILSNQFIKKGLSTGKMLPFGIPTYEKFSEKISKTDARRRLGIDDKLTVLIMGGSMGHGSTDTIEKLDKLGIDFQIVSVCGNNRKLKASIDAVETVKKVINFGFIDNVDLLMSASDCIITKPGGLTTSEALAKGLFIIMPNTFPGQEERNSEFLLNNGLAMRASKTFPLDECVYEFLNNKERRLCIETLASAIAKPNAANDLCEHIKAGIRI